MCKEFIRSFADMRVTNKDIWADAAMQYAVYSLFTAVMLLVLAECGNAVYHLSLMGAIAESW